MLRKLFLTLLTLVELLVPHVRLTFKVRRKLGWKVVVTCSDMGVWAMGQLDPKLPNLVPYVTGKGKVVLIATRSFCKLPEKAKFEIFEYVHSNLDALARYSRLHPKGR